MKSKRRRIRPDRVRWYVDADLRLVQEPKPGGPRRVRCGGGYRVIRKRIGNR